MKLVKPVKFKKAVKQLVLFLDANNGIQHSEAHKFWQEEVEAWKSNIDPKDWGKYLKVSLHLERAGIYLGGVWVQLEQGLNSYNNELIKIHKQINPKK